MPGTFIHLYGKAQTRTGRKMGHVTIILPNKLNGPWLSVRPMLAVPMPAPAHITG